VAQIQQNRWDQLVRRVAGIIGPGSKVNNTIGDLFPMLDVENLPGELYLLAGTRLGYGGGTITSAVAQTPRVQLFNPADSGLIVTITSLVISTAATLTMRMLTQPLAQATDTFNARVRDTRLGPATFTTCQVRIASDAIVLTSDVEFRTLPNTPTTFDDPNGVVVLAPGTGFTVTTAGTNQELQAAFWWRERVAEASELLF